MKLLATTPVRYCDQPGQGVAAIVNRDTDGQGFAELTVFTSNGPVVKHAVGQGAKQGQYEALPVVHVYHDVKVDDVKPKKAKESTTPKATKATERSKKL